MAVENNSSLREYRTLLPYLRRYRYRYVLGFLCLLIVDAAQVIIPQFMRRAVDSISSGRFAVKDVIIPSAIMTGLMGIVSLGRFFWRYFIHGSSRRIETELRKNLFEHLLSLSHDFYQEYKIGDLMARSTNDLNAVRESIGMGLVALVDGTIMATAIIIVIFIQDARTAAWAILPLPFITMLILLFGSVLSKRFRLAHEAYSVLSDTVQETFAGIRVVKSFVQEKWFIKKFADSNDNYRDANMALVQLFGIFFPLVTFLSGLTVLIVLLAGGIRVIVGFMSPGDLVALFRYLQMLIWPLMGAGFVVNMIQRGAVSMGRINSVMQTQPSIRSPKNPVASPSAESPLIDIRNLSFAYDKKNGSKVLSCVNMSIRKGSVVGIMGRTGSGKSTLVKAITRMIDTPPGTVFIKGVESAEWDLGALRKLFGVTPQDNFLFSDSIKNNIAYSMDRDSIQESILSNAASLAALDKDFSALEAGWNTIIGEKGLTLSGGQKQRSSIARSIAADREILILDDSLSSVDAETEKTILDGLLEFARAKNKKQSPESDGSELTMIIISHRVSALSRSDVVIVLERGVIIEQGTPAELAAMGGFYARTAALQSLGAERTDNPGMDLQTLKKTTTEQDPNLRAASETTNG